MYVSSAVLLFKLPRDRALVSTLGRQLYPNKSCGSALLEAYDAALADHESLAGNQYGYLFIDCSVHCRKRPCTLATRYVC